MGIPNFQVVFHDGIINKKIPKNQNLIINLDRRPNPSGTHYVALSNIESNPECCYFDSFSVAPSDIIKKYMKTSGKKCVYNTDDEYQKLDSVLCGLYCLYFLKKINKGHSFQEIIDDFTQHPSEWNEKLMKKFYGQLN